MQDEQAELNVNDVEVFSKLNRSKMVDNRSTGIFGVGGAFNFKSGDISGTAANTQDDKMGPGTEYGQIPDGEEEQGQQGQPYVDRSAQLRATLNSLAMMNVASVLNYKKRAKILDEITEDNNKTEKKEELDEEFLNDFDDDFDDESENDESEEEEDEYY